MTSDYQNPPITEVVFGIHFRPLARFLAPHYGLLWETLRSSGFEKLRELPPLPPKPTKQEARVPPSARVWYVSEAGERVLQVQRDRFLFNWRRTAPSLTYPGFDVLSGEFHSHVKRFTTFLRAFELGEVAPIEFELTYVNHILPGPLWEDLHQVGDVLPDFAWRHRDRMPLDLNLRTVLDLPTEPGVLLTSVRSPRRQDDNTPLLLFELSAKGLRATDDVVDAIDGWFAGAHDGLTEAFETLTSEAARAEWRSPTDGSSQTAVFRPSPEEVSGDGDGEEPEE